VLAVCYLLLLLLMVWFEESLIFFPSRYPQGDWQPAGLDIHDAWFEADDGTRLHGWYVPHPNPRAVVLFAHGNAGNVTHRIDQLWRLHHTVKVSVLVFDYRGYGRSDGAPDEQGILADTRAARRWLAEKSGVPEDKLVFLGESIGCGVLVDLASRDGARALVLQSPFTSLPEIGAYHYPWLPARLMMRNRLDSMAKIGRYHGPLLICHGEADTIIPFEHGQRLFNAANEPKQLVALPGHDHNDPMPDEYYQALDPFLDAKR